MKVIAANITWNEFGWRNLYLNTKAHHSYARKFPGHESLNFMFDKKNLDDDKFTYGFVQWKYPPKYFNEKGVIIFYSYDINNFKGLIVGVYCNAIILNEKRKTKWPGFENNLLISNIITEKDYSLLFPIALEDKKYSPDKRFVGQIGFSYKNEEIAINIIIDEIEKLRNSGIKFEEYKKLLNIYTLLTGKIFEDIVDLENKDIKEQEELIKNFVKNQNREQIIEDLKNIDNNLPEKFEYKGKHYKRNNKIIAQLKFLRNFRCQICESTILKKDGKFYIEAAHIIPKNKKGNENPDNILILCPNHHKEFDLGKREIKNQTNEKIELLLNNKYFCINMELK